MPFYNYKTRRQLTDKCERFKTRIRWIRHTVKPLATGHMEIL